MLLAAVRRIILLLVGSLVVISGVSLVLGLALGSSPARSVSLGLTVIGSFLLISGFFVGNRGPVRLKNEDAAPAGGPFFFGNRLVRWATPNEREETINLSAVFVSVGFALILIGVAADPRYTLF
jgi:hypothetical protein